MTYTIKAAKFANEDHTAITIDTVEAGSVSIGRDEHPDLWATALATAPASYVAPPAAQVRDLAAEIDKLKERSAAVEKAITAKGVVTVAEIDAKVEKVAKLG